jgi:putative oxidoreductase
MDSGLLILWVVVGVALIGRGTQKFFGWFGGHGRRGTGAFFELLGYRPGELFAIIAGLSEAGGGALLAVGFLTPSQAPRSSASCSTRPPRSEGAAPG